MDAENQDPTEGHTPDVLPLEQSPQSGLNILDRHGSVVASTRGLDDEQGRRWAAHIAREVNEAPKLRAEVERLREALKFYAGTEHRDEWLMPSKEVLGKWLTPIELDGGKRARAALDGEVEP